MQALDSQYSKRVEKIKKSIQGSEELSTYLENEEVEDYKLLQEKFEPEIAALHMEVVENQPMQSIALEEEILDQGFEGLFIPRILGYSVLRGELNAEIKYVRPQNHFRKILKAICQSANFDLIKQRIGQSVQMGFALSSDIWVTGFISDVDNKKIRTYLQNIISSRFRDPVVRVGAYARYKKQFDNMHFLTVDIPTNLAELTNGINNVVRFLEERSSHGLRHDSYEQNILSLIAQKEVTDSPEFVRLCMTLLKLNNVSDAIQKSIAETFNRLRKDFPRFTEIYFGLLQNELNKQESVNVEHDLKMAVLLDKSIDDEMLSFYRLMEVMHSKGYIHDDTIEEVRNFYNSNEGLSVINECLRLTVSGYFAKLMENLEISDYHDYFELSKTFDIYINLFSNEAFNQRVKKSNVSYIKKLTKHFTDKRSRDYQDVKKFVAIAFVNNGFFSEKEVVEFFKSKRKKKAE